MHRSTIKQPKLASTEEDGMTADQFKEYGDQVIDYICDYVENLDTLRVKTDIQPFHLQSVLPPHAPENPEDWDAIITDLDEKIIPCITHWNHPHFFAYFPSANSYPATLADMLISSVACLGFSWFASPACTELEMIALDWYAKAIGLPKSFIHGNGKGKGGGCIQGSASEAIFLTVIAARHQAVKALLADRKMSYDVSDECKAVSKLVAYISKEAHPCILKATKLAFIRARLLNVDQNNSLRGEVLKEAIEADVKDGLIPCYVGLTFGTTGTCAFDNIKEAIQVCRNYPYIWVHVDAAYAGSAMVCPELRYLMEGIEHVRSVNVNPNKWFLVNFDCSCLWVQNTQEFTEAIAVNKLYLQSDWEDETLEFRNWGVPLSRRFRALKLWFVLRCYGIDGLQYYIRNHCHLAKLMELYIRRDKRLSIMNNVVMGLVDFRVNHMENCREVSGDELTMLVLTLLNASGRYHLVPTYAQSVFTIRACITHQNATEEHVASLWNAIEKTVDCIENYFSERSQFSPRKKLTHKELQEDLKFIRKFSLTRSIDDSEFRRLQSEGMLSDSYSSLYVPDSLDDIVYKIDVGSLAKLNVKY